MNFLEDIKIYMNKDAKNLKILSNYFISPNYLDKKCENNICFGIDEYFLNNILFPYLLRQKLFFIYQITYSIIQYYFFKHPDIVKYHSSRMSKYKHKIIFDKYLKQINLHKYTFEEIDKILYNVKIKEDTEYNSSSVLYRINHDFYENPKLIITDEMRNITGKIFDLINELYKKKDFLIYDEYLLKIAIDNKKYFTKTYIKILNYDYNENNEIILHEVLF